LCDGDSEMNYLEWVKALGLPALALAIAFASWGSSRSSNRWQVRIAREKLKHDLYDRRFAVYMAFHELMVAIAENDDIDAKLRKANTARANSPFLLDSEVTQYLEYRHAEAFRLYSTQIILLNDPGKIGSRAEQIEMASRLASDKLAFANRIPELVERFRCLRLTDFSQ
jgi:hypothetical protein